jgi:hypothetical protein
MTDNEIIKALECCVNNGDCRECALNPKKGNYGYCTGLAIKSALDLITRQKAEIERLHSILLSFTDEVHTWSNKKGYDTTELSLISILDESKNIKANIKAEAYKEFAEILKEHQRSYDLDNYHSFEAVEINVIDEILREKAGDSDA